MSEKIELFPVDWERMFFTLALYVTAAHAYAVTGMNNAAREEIAKAVSVILRAVATPYQVVKE